MPFSMQSRPSSATSGLEGIMGHVLRMITFCLQTPLSHFHLGDQSQTPKETSKTWQPLMRSTPARKTPPMLASVSIIVKQV